MVEPDYYACNGLSPIKAFEQGLMSKDEFVGFCKGNVIKYTIRAGKKDDPLLDIVKAMDYLTYLHKALKADIDDSQVTEEVIYGDGRKITFPVTDNETLKLQDNHKRKVPVNGEKKDVSELQGNIISRLHKSLWKREDGEEY